MKERDLVKLNDFFKSWQGADAFLNRYIDDEDNRLIIGFERHEEAIKKVGISFLHCTFLSGPTRWKNNSVQCQLCNINGGAGFELFDKTNGFVLRCGGPIIVGDGKLLLSYNE